MSMGVILGLFNYIHFKKWVDIFGVFIPQLLFLWALFGYMDFLIFYKWANNWDGREAPFILNVMIDMFLKFPTVPETDFLFEGQVHIPLPKNLLSSFFS
jgi:V-type H+-transporting ATPase subunit a